MTDLIAVSKGAIGKGRQDKAFAYARLFMFHSLLSGTVSFTLRIQLRDSYAQSVSVLPKKLLKQ